MLEIAGVQKPEPVAKESVGRGADDVLEGLIDYRYRELVAYQNQAYAERYLALVNRARRAETELGGEAASMLTLTEAVARNYFKLLAYKDEYEVARLYSDGEFHKALARQFDGNLRLRLHLAPPLLARRDPDTGHLLKREYGAWMLKAFGVLAKFKFLRGRSLDPFGHTAERRLERQLIGDYEQQIEQLLEKLDRQRLPLAAEIAGLPHFIRGFGHVKEANVRTARRRAAKLIEQFDGAQVSLVNIHEPQVHEEA